MKQTKVKALALAGVMAFGLAVPQQLKHTLVGFYLLILPYQKKAAIG